MFRGGWGRAGARSPRVSGSPPPRSLLNLPRRDGNFSPFLSRRAMNRYAGCLLFLISCILASDRRASSDERLLSRRRRYVVFPEGSTFSVSKANPTRPVRSRAFLLLCYSLRSPLLLLLLQQQQQQQRYPIAYQFIGSLIFHAGNAIQYETLNRT